MKKTIMLLLLLSGGLLGPLAGRAQTDTDSVAGEPAPTPEALAEGVTPSADLRWEQANAAYRDGDYAAAAAAYEALLADGFSSAKLYYNLGNACFKENRLGEAILYYHRALRLDPGDEDTRYNLRVAEARTKDKIEQVPEFFLAQWLRSIRSSMSCTAWSLLSLLTLAAALGLFLFYLLSQRLSRRRTGFYGALVAALLFLLTTGFALGERRSMLDRSEAVVTASSASVKSAPDYASTDLFVLHEGTTVRITERLDKWCQVTIADGKKGWVEQAKIETI